METCIAVIKLIWITTHMCQLTTSGAGCPVYESEVSCLYVRPLLPAPCNDLFFHTTSTGNQSVSSAFGVQFLLIQSETFIELSGES